MEGRTGQAAAAMPLELRVPLLGNRPARRMPKPLSMLYNMSSRVSLSCHPSMYKSKVFVLLSDDMS